MKRQLSLLAAFLFASALSAQESIGLQWIDGSPRVTEGVSWGVPFEKGKIKPAQAFSLTNDKGNTIPLQSWVMARHIDGSVKWMGFAAAVSPDDSKGLSLKSIAKPLSSPAGLTVKEDASTITVNNSGREIIFNKAGANILKSITMDGRIVSENGRLVCLLEDRSQEADGVLRNVDFTSEIKKVTVEQSGPVKATIKVEGVHKALKGGREWLPFTVRFYLYEGVESVRMVHSIVFDGDQEKDFIKGLGIVFDVPLKEEMHNRHVKFSGEGEGMWNEPVQPMFGRRVISYPGEQNLYARQVDGERMPDKEKFNTQGQFLLNNWASWDDYSMSQLSPDGFTIRKRTNDKSTWIGTAGGNRSTGFALAGDVSGGLAVSLKNFWQSYPAEFEILDMRSERATFKIWVWSPKAQSMDLRHYDIVGHDLEAAYEDYQEGMSTPYGVARTSELTLFPFSGAMPTKEKSAQMADDGQSIVQLIASPEYMHKAGAFGASWSLEGAVQNEVGVWLEKQIDDYIDFYNKQIDQHKWYGFWNYGDMMHSYNTGRHMWNYDVGGQAWQNTELSPELWLWQAFIRSGRADIYKLATAMTRHTSEVDMYHIGDMQGLGTRHNVSHWGCGAKEARIGQAWWKRYYYYLTTDERLGDIMHEVIDVDSKMVKYDPLRVAQPREKFPYSSPARLRWGPDWIAIAGNWFTEYERTGDKKWLDKINVGMNCLAALPQGLFTGNGPLGYFPETGKIIYEGDPKAVTHSNHLANLMGGFEVMMELWDGVGNKKFNNVYLLYATYYALPQDDPMRDLPENSKYKDWWGHWNIPRITAFAYSKTGDKHLAEVAWKRMMANTTGQDGKPRSLINVTEILPPDALIDLDEGRGVSTNGAAQWNLDAIQMLQLAGSLAPSWATVAADNPPRQFGQGTGQGRGQGQQPQSTQAPAPAAR